jgi:putative glutamine amidotransferase
MTGNARGKIIPAGKFDHREDKTAAVAEQYGPAHVVAIRPGGVLAGLSDELEAVVNSVHGQGIDRLATGLRVEATAADGLIDAVSMPAAKGFVLALQWHPEWQWQHNPLSRAILAAFGSACRRYAMAKV